MSNTLTNQEKMAIIDQHIKSLDFLIYGLEMQLVQYNAAGIEDAQELERITNSLSVLNAKKTALNAEKSPLVEEA